LLTGISLKEIPKMLSRHLLFALSTIIILLLAPILPTNAQDQTILSLRSGTTELQTGQEYSISIQIDDVPELWMASVEITYDPSMLYVFGTQSGSPVTLGAFWTPELSLSIRNSVSQGVLSYTASQLSPAELLDGSGVIGTFRIYPLAPGKTTLTIRQAELTTVTFVGEGEERTGTDPRPVPVVAALLELNITGNPVPTPVEPTATPEPTATATAQFIPTRPAGQPTLANITLAPGATTTSAPAAEVTSEQDEGISSLLIVGILAVLMLASIGAIVIFRRARR
jgi:hypothetical protein